MANPLPAIFIGPRRHVSVAKSHRNLKKCLAATWGIRRDVDRNSGLWQILANVMEEIPEDMVNIPLVTGIHRWQVVVCDF